MPEPPLTSRPKNSSGGSLACGRLMTTTCCVTVGDAMAPKGPVFDHRIWVASSHDTPCECGSTQVEAISCWQFPDD